MNKNKFHLHLHLKDKNLVLFVIALLLNLIPLLIIYNRFVPVQEGWFHYDSMLIKRGYFPYKDFFVYLQPMQLFIANFWAIWGDGFIVARVYGIIERMLVLFFLYRLFSRFFSPAATFIATMGSFPLYQSLPFDPLYAYYQTGMLFFLIALNIFFHNRIVKWLGVGLFTAMLFWTKQSTGVFVSAFFVFLIFWDGKWKQYLVRLFYFGIGYLIPTILVMGWLISNNALEPYIRQVFGGIGAKGTIFSMLFSFFPRAMPLEEVLTIFFVSIPVFLLYNRGFLRIEKGKFDNKIFLTLVVVLLSIGIIAAGIMTDLKVAIIFRVICLLLSRFVIHLTFFSLLIAIAIFLFRRFSKGKNWQLTPSEVLVFAGFTWMYVYGISYQLEEGSVIPATTFIFAFFYDRIRINRSQWMRRIIIFLAVAFMLNMGLQKFYWTYNWWGWGESATHSESAYSKIPQLEGFYLSSSTVAIYDTIYSDIITNTTPEDKVYTFPHIPFFNYITGRLQPTFSPVHYFDVCPDWMALEDAKRLKDNPPKMIVYLEVPEEDFVFHEVAYRGGSESGQRAIRDTLTDLFITQYRQIDAFKTPWYDWNLTVWVRND